jgi:hypothetical protein
VPPDDQRCEALVAGIPSYNFEWQRLDHRCPRRANQGRAGRAVCYSHAKAKRLRFYTGEKVVTGTERRADGERRALVEMIDMTPTWQGILPALIVMLTEGNANTREAGRLELEKMARAADLYNASMKPARGDDARS